MDAPKFRTEARVHEPKSLIFGKHGTGKTSFALSTGKPTVVFNLDNGLEEILRQNKGNDVQVADFFPVASSSGDEKEAQATRKANAETWDRFLDTLRWLYSGKHDRTVFVIDSIDAAENLACDYVCYHKGKASISEFDYGKGYGLVRDQMTTLLRACNSLNEDKGMEPILLAHAAVRKNEEPHLPAYDAWQIKLNKNVAPLFMEWADAALFLAFKSIVVPEQGDFGKKKQKAHFDGNRIFLTSPQTGIEAKNRFNFPSQIPASYDEYRKLIEDFRNGKSGD